MKNKFGLLIFLSIIGITFSSLKVDEGNKKAIKGTYQIQFKQGKDHNTPVSLTADLLEKIEKNRSENKITFLTPEDNYQIMILPYNTIKDPHFKPVIDYIIME